MSKIKCLILGLGLLVLGVSKAHATVDIDDTVNYEVSHSSVSVSSYVATGFNQLLTAYLIGTSTSWPVLQENRKGIEIINLSTSADLFCRIGLSSTSAAGDLSLTAPSGLATTQGKKLAPGSSWYLGLRARNQDGRVLLPFCVNNGGSGTSLIEFIQYKSK